MGRREDHTATRSQPLLERFLVLRARLKGRKASLRRRRWELLREVFGRD